MRVSFLRPLPFAILLLLGLTRAAAAGEPVAVECRTIEDRKAVIATVETSHLQIARTRIGGTVGEITVREGSQVNTGDRIALVGDPKLLLQLKALDARIASQRAQRDQAKIDFDRATALRKSNVGSQAQLDEARTRLEIAERQLAALGADRDVIAQRVAEGAVLAPDAGRVLTVPVIDGSVVQEGETIATIASAHYILRLQLPERHARFIREGDTVAVGARGMRVTGGEPVRQGRVVKVYPEIEQGRVIADVEVAGIGDYFVGERTPVYVPTGARQAIVLPRGYAFRRFGVDYVKLADGREITVQLGEPAGDGIEVLSGLRAGDMVVAP